MDYRRQQRVSIPYAGGCSSEVLLQSSKLIPSLDKIKCCQGLPRSVLPYKTRYPEAADIASKIVRLWIINVLRNFPRKVVRRSPHRVGDKELVFEFLEVAWVDIGRAKRKPFSLEVDALSVSGELEDLQITVSHP